MSIPSICLAALVFTAFIGGVVVDANTAYETIKDRPCFRSMKGMLDSMLDLSKANPDLLTITDIGDSYLKNNPGKPFGRYEIPADGHDIYAIKVTAPKKESSRNSRSKGKMLITSGVHAREYAPPELAGRFVEHLINEYNKNDAEITTILQTSEVHVILYVNPDGRHMAEKYPELYWRKNLNPNGGCTKDDKYGTDINRNFDFMWGDPAGASSDACDSVFHGISPESEPESQALAEYARGLFPASQRKQNPEKEMNKPFGEDNTGMYIDVHSSGGYIYYPWGHRDAKSPNDESLQALGRKISSFNGYKLWAGDQPDFVYEASGDTSDWAYAVLGVASFGFEIGNEFYQQCNSFEREVVPQNLPALVYAAKLVNQPFKEVKGPDVTDLKLSHGNNGKVEMTAHISDGQMVNTIKEFPNFTTGDQMIQEVQVYVDVHPDDYNPNKHDSWLMQPTNNNMQLSKRTRINCGSITRKKKCKRVGGGGICGWRTQRDVCVSIRGNGDDNNGEGGGNSNNKPSGSDGPAGKPSQGSGGDDEYVFESGDEDVKLVIDTSNLSPGKHVLHVQATDSKGYRGPVSSIIVKVLKRRRDSLLRGGSGQ